MLEIIRERQALLSFFGQLNVQDFERLYPISHPRLEEGFLKLEQITRLRQFDSFDAAILKTYNDWQPASDHASPKSG